MQVFVQQPAAELSVYCDCFFNEFTIFSLLFFSVSQKQKCENVLNTENRFEPISVFHIFLFNFILPQTKTLCFLLLEEAKTTVHRK